MVATVQLDGSKTYPIRHATFIKITPVDRPVGGVLEIREAKKASGVSKYYRYALKETNSPTEGDRAFRLTKPGGETYYDVFLCAEPDPPRNEDGSPYDSCDCLGFERYSSCKHLEALRCLLEAGHLESDVLPSYET